MWEIPGAGACYAGVWRMVMQNQYAYCEKKILIYREGQDSHLTKNGSSTSEAKVVKSEANDSDLYDAAIEPSGQGVKSESSSQKSNTLSTSQGNQSKCLPALGVNQNSTGRRYCCYIGDFFFG